MSEAERIERLENLVAKLASALYRQNSEQDGNWGWPSFHDEMKAIQAELAPGQGLPVVPD